eukprot:7768295-Pyramimonas_sp.AAC.1
MAGALADIEVIISATDEEIQLVLYARLIGTPTNMELSDDDPVRGNPRDASDLSERIQCELGHNERFPCAFVASDRSMGRQRRSVSRQVKKKKYCDDDDDEDLATDGRLERRGRIPSRSPNRARERSSCARSSGLQRPHPPDA